jgi:hypothetical protein
MEAAAAGRLDSPAGVLTEAKRLLASPRARARVAQEDRRKIEAHLEAVRTIETRLGRGPSKCAAPSVIGSMDVNALEATPAVLDRQIELLARAVACDLTRVISLQFRLGEVLALSTDGKGVVMGSESLCEERERRRADRLKALPSRPCSGGRRG